MACYPVHQTGAVPGEQQVPADGTPRLAHVIQYITPRSGHDAKITIVFDENLSQFRCAAGRGNRQARLEVVGPSRVGDR